MRIFDVMVSAIALVVLAPVLAVVAVAVRLTSAGSALYRAPRLGRQGKIFTMYKFRTMRQDSGGSRITAGDHDPRVTPLGAILRKTKIDELPQLINVLKGDMALVGPRPEDPSFLPHYTAEEWEVFSVRPGITCRSQLRYSVLTDQVIRPGDDPTEAYLTHIFHQRLALDREYVRTRSLWGDLSLIGTTVLYVAGVKRSAP